jgi:hypothetical protein
MKTAKKKPKWIKPPNSRRSRRFDVRLTPIQADEFDRVARELGITRTDLFLKWLTEKI